jgi:hypothetical protein
MPVVYPVRGMRAFGQLFARHQKERMKKLLRAVRRAAHEAIGILKRHVPVAFGELRESVDAKNTEKGATVVVDAPHAAAVEVGSRPHTPPLEPLIAWVRLRGMQALLSERERGRLPGVTTKASAEHVGVELAKHVKDGASDVDAPKRVAFMIQQKIARTGTMPHWYARASLPDVRRVLDACVRDALARPD